jgi:hypothetical protein
MPRRQRPRQLRGYVLLLVLMLAMLLSVATAVLLDEMRNAGKVTGESIQRKKVFYAADGMTKAAVHLANQYLAENPAPAADDLQNWFEDDSDGGVPPVDDITPTGFDRELFTISTTTTASVEDIPNGPFAGMTAEQRPMSVTVKLRNPNNGTASVHRSSVVTAQVSAFQFFGFVDGYAYLVNGPGAKFAGRVHTNGNACAGANDPLYLEHLTSAGQFGLQGATGICRGEHSGDTGWRDLNMPSAPLPNGAAQYGMAGWAALFNPVNYDATSGTWQADATADFGDQLQDQAHGVPNLSPPISGAPLAQRGRNAAGNPTDNTGNSRFLIDPRVSGEPDDVWQQKIAYKADIRILNGVWYKREPTAPEQLGTPIWSDRPGQSSNHNDETWDGSTQTVGQQSLFASGARPTRYSYYRTDPGDSTTMVGSAFAAPSTASDDRPVVSYGPVYKKAANLWVPGYFKGEPDSCTGTGSSSLNDPCYDVYEADTAARLAQGTRSGFRDAWFETAFSTNANDCGQNPWSAMPGITPPDSYQNAVFNILPLNFDVGAFQMALADTDVDELGHSSLFNGGNDFNGIVWIGSTWPGHDNGYGASYAASAQATYWPYQGR